MTEFLPSLNSLILIHILH